MSQTDTGQIRVGADVGGTFTDVVLIDGDGRIVLPGEFLEKAQLDGKALFVGGGPKFHIWHPKAYAAHRQETQEAFAGRTLPSLTRPSP